MPELANRIRAKYPGQYDDLDDATLESKILEKHPEYKDLTTPTKPEPSADTLLNEAKATLNKSEQLSPTKLNKQNEDKGFLSRAWDTLSQPLTTKPSELAHRFANYIDNPNREYRHPLASFGAGAIEGAGDLLSGLTSPINLAATLLTGGESLAAKQGLPQVARLANIGSRIASAPVAIHGATNVLSPNSSLQERGFGLTELAGGLAGTLHQPSLKPEINPSLASKIIDAEINPSVDNILRNSPYGEGSILPGKLPTELDTTVNEPDVPHTPITFKEDVIPPSAIRPDLVPVGEESTYNDIFTPNKTKGLTEEELYNRARQKTGMGLDNPDLVENKPTAEYIGEQEEVGPQFNVKGGKYNNSTVGLERLKELGIDVPSTSSTESKLPVGTTVVIKSDKATPINVKKARAAGFDFDSVNDEGNFRFKKVSEQPLETRNVGDFISNESGEAITPFTKTDIINIPRTIMASMDMSAPLRQGLGLIYTPQYWRSIGGMFKSFGSEEAFNAIQNAIKEKPLFKSGFAEQTGLKLTDVGTDLTRREESMMSRLAEKVPGIRASNRAYVGFLNKLRADTFESLINQGKVFGADGTTNLPLAREIADFVNTATGRGSLGALEKHAQLLNNTLFSPRLIASRLQMLNPMYYTMANPFVRREAIKSLLAIAGTGATVGQLAKLAGANVESDIASADFGKIKVGNTRIDPFGGFQQYVVAAQRLMPHIESLNMGGRMKSTTTGHEYNLSNPKYGQSTRLDVAGRFAETKLNPTLSFVTGILRGKNLAGQPFNIPEEIAQRFIPMFVQDLKSILTNNQNMLPTQENYNEFHPEKAPLAIPAFFGMGTQNYGSRP